MRTTLILVFSLFWSFGILHAQANKAAGAIVEHSLNPLAKEAAEKAAKELIERATISSGKEMEAQTAKSLEAQLARTIEQHGDAVIVLARRVPEATSSLASRAPQLLPLAEKFGDDILRIEARAPGYAEMAAKSFGKEDLPRLLKLGKPEMKGVLNLSTHTTEPAATKLLLEGAEKDGMKFLEKVSGPQILAGGLSTAAIILALRSERPDPNKLIPAFFEWTKPFLMPSCYVVAGLILAWGALRIWRGYKKA
ncbi:MAG: hypothetical protein K8R87_08135 [Verrucomicrobia bacterium]|nr:hypothetical protein [Verrucomicrobiota bacterium]